MPMPEEKCKSAEKGKEKRDPNKTRKWEQERRQRLSQAFNRLHKELPSYDPSVKLSHIEILDQAVTAIKSIDEKLKNVVQGSSKSETVTVVRKLEDRIKKLLIRNEQLCNLLRDAGIRIPSEWGNIHKFKRRYPWTGRFSTEQANTLQKKVLESTKEETNVSKKAIPKKRKLKLTSPICVAPKHRKVTVDGNISRNKLIKKKLKHKSKDSFMPNEIQYSNTNTSVITTVISNSVLTTPVASSIVQPTMLVGNTPISNLGPGTLILANGTVLPVVPPQSFTAPFISPVNNNVILATTKALEANKNTVLLSSNFTQKKTDCIKNIALLNTKLPPKVPAYCITLTTQVNKVPIPSLAPKHSSNSSTLSNLCKAKVRENKKASSNSSFKTDKKECKKVHELETRTVDVSESSANDVESQQTKETSKHSNDLASQPTGAAVTTKIDYLKAAETEITSKADDLPSENKEDDNVLDHDEEVNFERSDKNCSSNINRHASAEDIDSNMNLGTNFNNENKPVCTLETSITASEFKPLELNLPHSELSNDIFESLQVPPGSQNADSTSPTAAFLLAFPLVSSNPKVSEILGENSESQSETQLLQLGELNSKADQDQGEALPSSFLNLDTFTVFPNSNLESNYCSNVISTDINNIPGKVDKKYVGHSHSKEHSFDSNFNVTQIISKVDMSTSQSVISNTVTNSQNKDSSNGSSSCHYGSSKMPEHSFAMSQVLSNTHSNYSSTNKNEYANQCMPKVDCLKKSENLSNIPNKMSVCSWKINQHSVSQQMPKVDEQNFQNIDKNQKTLKLQLPNFELPKPEFNLIQNYSNANYSQRCIDKNTTFNQACSKIKPTSGNNEHLKQDNGTSEFPNRIQSSQCYNLPNFSYSYKSYCNSEVKEVCNSKPLNICFNITENKLSNSMTDQAYLKQNCIYDKKSENACSSFQNNYNQFYPTTNSYSQSHTGNSSNFTSNYYKNNSAKPYYPLNVMGTTKNENYFSADSFYTEAQNKCAVDVNKTKPVNDNKHTNWLSVTDTTSFKPDYFLQPFSKEGDFYQSNCLVPSSASAPTYFNNFTNDVGSGLPDFKKMLELPPINTCQKETDDIQFTWSPTKVPQLFDPPSFLPSTLPTLVGDLALNTSGTPEPKKVKRKTPNPGNQSQTNFFSVSQLVESSKNNIPAKTTTRRNSGNRSNKDSSLPRSRKSSRDSPRKQQNNQASNIHGENLFYDPKATASKKSVASSSYSAEALIGNQTQSVDSSKSTSKPIVTSFLSDNSFYFPPIELGSDNQHFQTNNFAAPFQTSNFSSNSFMTSASFATDVGTYDFLINDNFSAVSSSNKSKAYANQNFNEKNQNTLCSKKLPNTKKKSSAENTLPSLDFSFLSAPVTINAPMVSDDFHSHGFLTTSTSFPCKNSTHKQNLELNTGSHLLPLVPSAPAKPGIQHPQVSPSLNTGPSSSFANFNLSTIFPEINKDSISETFSENK